MESDGYPAEPDDSAAFTDPGHDAAGGSWHADTGDGPPTAPGDVPYVEPVGPFPEPAGSAPGPRRWPLALGLLTLLPVVAALLVALVSAREARDDWEQRAVEAEGDADELAAQLSVTAQDAESLEDAVPTLRDDMAAAEERLVAATRDLESARSDSGAAALRAILATDAADKTRRCLEVSNDLLQRVLAAYERNTTLTHLVPLADDVNALCAVADESYAAFSRAQEDRSDAQVAGIQ